MVLLKISIVVCLALAGYWLEKVTSQNPIIVHKDFSKSFNQFSATRLNKIASWLSLFLIISGASLIVFYCSMFKQNRPGYVIITIQEVIGISLYVFGIMARNIIYCKFFRKF